ncbi:MAG: glycosyltransferase family 39 protein [bacterium]|nr:MAG: glycosyltransferase family 39 protein [bacterium]
MWRNKLTYIVLAIIVILAGFMRFYKLDQIPASLNWDEVAAGYNAYTIANWGMDEYGDKFPTVFTSFYDDKHPVHIYITSVIVKIFGLNDYSVRSSSALIGTLSVIAIFLFARELLRSNLAGLFAALFLAVSPYHIHFSRGLWENNFALFFLITGLASFYIGLRTKKYLIPISFLFFGLSFFSYHSAKVVVPVVVFLVCLINLKKLLKNKTLLMVSVLITLLFGILIIKDTRILGFARMGQTKFSEELILNAGGKLNLVFENYKKHFTHKYLFENGDQGPRASVKVVGQFYRIDLILLGIGFISLLYRKKWQALAVIFTWLLLSPIPSAVSSTDPSSIRGIFMIIPMLLLSACGADALLSLFKSKWLKAFMLVIILTFLFREVTNYLNYYTKVYPTKEAIEWQYGMKEIVEYTRESPDFYKMYVDNIRQQPYIYFLYYNKVSLPELLKTVKYDQSSSKSFNTVLSFGRYQFGGWNIIESYPNNGILYAVTPSYYTGLRFAPQFDVKRLIKYPDNSDAFYIVEGQGQ